MANVILRTGKHSPRNFEWKYGCTLCLGAILEDFSRIYSKEMEKLFYAALVCIWNLHMDVETSLFTQEKSIKCVYT